MVASPVRRLTTLNRYSDTISGHVSFIDFVAREVHEAALAVREQHRRGYSNETIEMMLAGILWSEAAVRLELLRPVSASLVDEIQRLFIRPLTRKSIEAISRQLEIVTQRLYLICHEALEAQYRPARLSGLGASEATDHAEVGRVAGSERYDNFLGGDELMRALRVHPSRAKAFGQQLMRKRGEISATDRRTRSTEHANCARYLYRADSPVLVAIAAKYSGP